MSWNQSAAPRDEDLYETGVSVNMGKLSEAFDLAGKLLGEQGENLKYIENATGAQIALQWQGSDEAYRDSHEPILVQIRHSTIKGLELAEQLVNSLVKSIKEEYNEFLEKEYRDMENMLGLAPGSASTAKLNLDKNRDMGHDSGRDLGGGGGYKSASNQMLGEYSHSSNGLYCELCGIHCPNNEAYNIHLSGVLHTYNRAIGAKKGSTAHMSHHSDNRQIDKHPYHSMGNGKDSMSRSLGRESSNTDNTQNRSNNSAAQDTRSSGSSSSKSASTKPSWKQTEDLCDSFMNLLWNQTQPDSLQTLTKKLNQLTDGNYTKYLDRPPQSKVFCRLCLVKEQDLTSHLWSNGHKLKYLQTQLDLGMTTFPMVYGNVPIDMDTNGGRLLATNAVKTVMSKSVPEENETEYTEMVLMYGKINGFTCSLCNFKNNRVLNWVKHVTSMEHAKECILKMQQLGYSEYEKRYGNLPAIPPVTVKAACEMYKLVSSSADDRKEKYEPDKQKRGGGSERYSPVYESDRRSTQHDNWDKDRTRKSRFDSPSGRRGGDRQDDHSQSRGRSRSPVRQRDTFSEEVERFQEQRKRNQMMGRMLDGDVNKQIAALSIEDQMLVRHVRQTSSIQDTGIIVEALTLLRSLPPATARSLGSITPDSLIRMASELQKNMPATDRSAASRNQQQKSGESVSMNSSNSSSSVMEAQLRAMRQMQGMSGASGMMGQAATNMGRDSMQQGGGSLMSSGSVSGQLLAGRGTSDRGMSDQRMSSSGVSDGRMSGDLMSGRGMLGRDMSGRQMAGGALAGDAMSGRQMTSGAVSVGNMSGGGLMSRGMMSGAMQGGSAMLGGTMSSMMSQGNPAIGNRGSMNSAGIMGSRPGMMGPGPMGDGGGMNAMNPGTGSMGGMGQVGMGGRSIGGGSIGMGSVTGGPIGMGPRPMNSGIRPVGGPMGSQPGMPGTMGPRVPMGGVLHPPMGARPMGGPGMGGGPMGPRGPMMSLPPSVRNQPGILGNPPPVMRR